MTEHIIESDLLSIKILNITESVMFKGTNLTFYSSEKKSLYCVECNVDN
jgi:hypothetical protein